MSKPVCLRDLTHHDLKAEPPTLAVLPWGATEAHNQHLPYGTDIIEAEEISRRAGEMARERGARLIVLPAIPFGNNAQQLDQAATIHLRTTTAYAILSDVAASLKRQRITRLVILNAHGGNDFKPLVRDVMLEHGVFVAVVNFWQVSPEASKRLFAEPGDHAGALETSLLLHWCPQCVQTEHAGPGTGQPFAVPALRQPGVWTPRPWSQIHPDLGAGNPAEASAEKGAELARIICMTVADLLVQLAAAERLP